MQIDTTLLPTRGNDAVEILLNDHQVIKSLLRDLTQATGRRREEVLQKLKGVLTIHNATEENLVHPAIDKVAGSKLEAQHLYHETAEADTLLFELDSMLKERDESDFSMKAEKFADAVPAPHRGRGTKGVSTLTGKRRSAESRNTHGLRERVSQVASF